ncbi:nucleoside deaminase [Roseivirga misakiensis]|uniref:tRNA-specific adenosine deaminase n=1 Tax=Roseivirga misakiensis TaxID=1563681 RepID=A0A1E5T7C3_9BACT|nr:nucleoside deaminase [Roseivirga misakiensis]OEK07246.1 tRNA-specific adenosine deaminase [Roseivirga misakiensis]
MKLSVHKDEYFMGEALKQAELAAREGEVPVGAVVVAEKRIIARAHNQTEMLTDVTAHAEMLAITSAFNAIGAKYLNECTLYVTLEPCVMCAGALYWAQLGKLVYGAADEKRGFSRHDKNLLHPRTEMTSGLLKENSEKLLKEFFARLR